MKTHYERMQAAGIPMFLIPDFVRKRLVKSHNQGVEVDPKLLEDWSLTTSFKTQLFLRASTYDPFPGPYEDLPHDYKQAQRFGDWGLYSPICKKGKRIRLYQKNGDRDARMGWVQWDGDVYIPSLYRHSTSEMVMGLSPFECMTVKWGARFAKGRVVITGLGLGYLLWLCSRRKQVKHITVCEIDEDIIEYIMPRIRPYLGPVPIDIVTGDCRNRLLKLSGDVLLADHFDSYGWNGDWYQYDSPLRAHIENNFGKVWTWG